MCTVAVVPRSFRGVRDSVDKFYINSICNIDTLTGFYWSLLYIHELVQVHLVLVHFVCTVLVNTIEAILLSMASGPVAKQQSLMSASLTRTNLPTVTPLPPKFSYIMKKRRRTNMEHFVLNAVAPSHHWFFLLMVSLAKKPKPHQSA